MSTLRSLRAQWDRILGTILLGGGSVAVLGSALAIAGSQNQADRLAFLASGVIGGVFCVTVGVALLVSASFQDAWRRIERTTTAAPAEITLPQAVSGSREASQPTFRLTSRAH